LPRCSSGERALTAIALLFAIYLIKPSPFCLLDEVDAPLDEANVDRFVALLQRFSQKTQFIMITHNKKTMEAASALYGVTMQEPGVSRLVSVRFETPESRLPGDADEVSAERPNAERRLDEGDVPGVTSLEGDPVAENAETIEAAEPARA